MSWQAQTTSNFPPPGCKSSMEYSDVMVVDNTKSENFQCCLHGCEENHSSKSTAKHSSKAIARRLRELCDHFEAEFTIGRMRQPVTVKKGNTVDKVASWVFPKPFFQTWRGSYI